MQDVSRKYKISIEKLSPSFRIMADGERPLSDKEAEENCSYYIDGLWMYGAQWDPEQCVLIDLPHKTSKLGSTFPMIHVTVA